MNSKSPSEINYGKTRRVLTCAQFAASVTRRHASRSAAESRSRRDRARRACGKGSNGRSAACGRLPTSARGSGRSRSESRPPRSPPAAGPRRSASSSGARRPPPAAAVRRRVARSHRRARSGARRDARPAPLRRRAIAGAARGPARRSAGIPAAPISSPSASTTARNTAFSSWRTLPGQRKALSSASASAATRADALALLGGEAREEMAHQVRDVLRPLAQRRHRDRKDVQAVEQVLAETALLHVVDQVAVGGRDDAHVDLDRLARADRLDLALLDRAQQLDLRGRRQLADLVEEQRAAGGLDEFAGVALGGAGEGALLVAEQDRLDEVVGDGAAIDRDERLGAPLAGAVDGARDQLLADAGFALDQHRDGGAGGLLGRAQHRLHARAAGDDVAEGERAGAAALDQLEFALERARRERVAQRDLQPLGADRLDHEIDGAGAHRGDDIVDAAMGGLHDHRDASGPPRACAPSTPRPSRSGITRSRTTQSMRAVRRRRAAATAASPPSAMTARSRSAPPCSRSAGAAPDRRRRSGRFRPCDLPPEIVPNSGALWPRRINGLLSVALTGGSR